MCTVYFVEFLVNFCLFLNSSRKENIVVQSFIFPHLLNYLQFLFLSIMMGVSFHIITFLLLERTIFNSSFHLYVRLLLLHFNFQRMFFSEQDILTWCWFLQLLVLFQNFRWVLQCLLPSVV